MTSPYDSAFYRYQREGALASANTVLPILAAALPIRSVLDVGCGAGAWLAAHRHAGVTDMVGVDGDYVDRDLLLFDLAAYRVADVTHDFDLGRKFDLVECLEVAEHLPASAADTLVANLARHGDTILFSAATPGQGGKGHINEQPIDYWREKFQAHGYRAFDVVRPAVRGVTHVEWWYRFNTLLYVHGAAADALPEAVLATELDPANRVPRYDPWPFATRKAVLAALPHQLVSGLAAVKHRVIAANLARG